MADRSMASADAAACRNCRHFFNASPAIESALPGLSSLSSAYASVRADDGVCSLHDRYIAAESVCGRHAARLFIAPRLPPDSRRKSALAPDQ
jgi:hypothetical protein